MNQAGALVHLYTDGSVHLNHGGTEMGQGLMIKVAQIVAAELQVDLERVHDQRHVDRQGAQHLADRRLERHRPQRRGGARRVPRPSSSASSAIAPRPTGCARTKSSSCRTRSRSAATKTLSFAQLVREAYLARVQLSATGY